eukprot:PhM_4_TR5299/c0_g1_i2/m.86976
MSWCTTSRNWKNTGETCVSLPLDVAELDAAAPPLPRGVFGSDAAVAPVDDAPSTSSSVRYCVLLLCRTEPMPVPADAAVANSDSARSIEDTGGVVACWWGGGCGVVLPLIPGEVMPVLDANLCPHCTHSFSMSARKPSTVRQCPSSRTCTSAHTCDVRSQPSLQCTRTLAPPARRALAMSTAGRRIVSTTPTHAVRAFASASSSFGVIPGTSGVLEPASVQRSVLHDDDASLHPPAAAPPSSGDTAGGDEESPLPSSVMPTCCCVGVEVPPSTTLIDVGVVSGVCVRATDAPAKTALSTW